MQYKDTRILIRLKLIKFIPILKKSLIIQEVTTDPIIYLKLIYIIIRADLILIIMILIAIAIVTNDCDDIQNNIHSQLHLTKISLILVQVYFWILKNTFYHINLFALVSSCFHVYTVDLIKYFIAHWVLKHYSISFNFFHLAFKPMIHLIVFVLLLIFCFLWTFSTSFAWTSAVIFYHILTNNIQVVLLSFTQKFNIF